MRGPLREDDRFHEAAPRRLATALAAVAGGILIVGAWFVLQLWGLGWAPFHTKGEPREGLVVLEIVAHGDWLLPRRNGIELPTKPPLFHWLGAVAALVHGTPDEWSIRLPSAVLSGLAALVVFATGVAIWGVRSALLAALMLLTSFEWLRAATSARVDMTLTFGLALAFCGLLLVRAGRARRTGVILLHTGSAWAVLAKGPVGLALPLLQIAVISMLDRNLAYARCLRPSRGAVAVLLVAAGWYIAAALEGGREFFETHILRENFFRFLGTRQFAAGHRHSVGYLFGALLAGLLPWTLFLPGPAMALWRRRAILDRRDPDVFAALWAVVVFVFYALATSKRGVYLLALYPAVALLTGSWWDAIMRGAGDAPRLRHPLPAAAWISAVVLGLAALVAAAQHAGLPLFAATASALRVPAAEVQLAESLERHAALLAALLAVAAAMAALTAAGVMGDRWGLAFAGVFALAAALSVGTRLVVMPEVARQVTRQRFAEVLRRIVPGPDQVASYRQFDYGLAFYWGGDLPVVAPPLFAAGAPYLVVAEREWVRLDPPARGAYERIPGLRSGRAGNMGELVLARRLAGAPTEREPPVLERDDAVGDPRS